MGAASVTALSTVGALLTASVSMLLVIFTKEFLSPLALTILIPLIAYSLSIATSVLYQYSECGVVQLQSIALQNLSILGSNGAATLLLFLEQLFLGGIEPANPFDKGTPEYIQFLASAKTSDYTFLANIVKGVIPDFVDETTKEGFVYFYYTFFLTMLPSFFFMSLQGICSPK
jgi:hypothetical protein